MLVFAFFSSIASAQNKGIVLEKNLNKPLAEVNIVSTDSRVTSITNGKGSLFLEIYQLRMVMIRCAFLSRILSLIFDYKLNKLE